MFEFRPYQNPALETPNANLGPHFSPPNIMRTLSLFALFAVAMARLLRAADYALPVRVGPDAVLLHGDWKFKYLPTSQLGTDATFFQPAFDVSAWSSIPVPSHWELHGFAEPQYASSVKEGMGLYRRNFRVAGAWQGKKVFLRFDGVLYGMTVWLNGKLIGEWASSFNPATFEVTDALLPGDQDNVLAVCVTTRSKGWEFDTMDCWGLSGIFRDVTLFALPQSHLSDYTARTTLKSNGTAEMQLEVVANKAANVSARLVSPDGTLANAVQFALGADGRGSTILTVNQPKLWTAETPSLYRLELDLQVEGKTLQHFTDRVGLRQVTIENGIFKLNGTSIKLHGIDHHDIWPLEGRVASEALMRRDLELIRGANINFIRTSHYPPHPRFIELCDELGIYVDCEVPFVHGREHHTDPAYQEVLLTRARATVQRDKNRPSIILWSIGNENHITGLGLNTGRLVKQMDPTRPITYPTMGSYFRSNYEDFPEFVDLYSPHYPSPGTVKDYASKLTRPLVFTEFAHQRGLARGGTGVQDIWETMYHSPRVAGGAVWMFQDQGLLRTAVDPQAVKNGDLMVWLDEHHYYDTNGYYAVDGIVYADRTPQVDYWQVRKVYSPVQVEERSLQVLPEAKSLEVHVENRFDFRTLDGFRLEWSANMNRRAFARGIVPLQAKPHEVERVSFPVTLPDHPGGGVVTLELRCLDEAGRSFYERSIELASNPALPRLAVLKATLPQNEPILEVSDALISVRHPNYSLRLNRKSGRISILDPAGATVVSAVGPHTARKLTINDLGKSREGEATHWGGELLHDVTRLTTAAQQTSDGVLVSVAGVYPRPGFAKESIEGEYRLLLTPSGTIEMSYHYVPVAATGVIVEAGLAFEVAPSQSEFRWIGQGPYAGYPGRDRLNEFGIFHLNRDDLYFPGNRRGVELAALASSDGPGIMIGGDRLTVSVEKRDTATIFSHLALVAGQASDQGRAGEDVESKAEIKAASIKAISGKFTLMPLNNDWPEPLLKWFGPAAEKVAPFKPFLRVYDQ